MIETLVDTIVDAPIGEQAGEAALTGIQHQRLTVHVEIGFLLSRKTRGRQVLSRRRTAYRYTELRPVLFLERMIGGQNFGSKVLR
jgi:hypothetical protein